MLIGSKASAVLLTFFGLGLLWSFFQIKKLAGKEGIPSIIKLTVYLMFFYTYFHLVYPLYFQIVINGPPVLVVNFESAAKIANLLIPPLVCTLCATQLIKGSKLLLIISALSVLWGAVSLYLVFVWAKSRPFFSSNALLFNPYYAFNYFIAGSLFLTLSLMRPAREYRAKCSGNKTQIPFPLLLACFLLHAQLAYGVVDGLFTKNLADILATLSGSILVVFMVWFPVLLGLRWGDPFSLSIFRFWVSVYFALALFFGCSQVMAKSITGISFSQVSYIVTFASALWLCFCPTVKRWKQQLQPAF